jgi:outer membrane protein TolC
MSLGDPTHRDPAETGHAILLGFGKLHPWIAMLFRNSSRNGPPDSAGVWLALLALACGDAQAAEADTLGELVTVALERHPELTALDLDRGAAHAQTRAAGRPMDPTWMLAAQSLGAMPDSVDPTMFMIGVEQMLALPPVYRASRERAALDVRWAEGERTRVAADVKEGLWEAAARLRAQAAQGRALDEQIAAAETALAFGRARYASGAGASNPAPSSGAGAESEPATVPPPAVRAPTSAGGMSGMGGGPSSRPTSGGGMGGASMGAPGGMGGAGDMGAGSMAGASRGSEAMPGMAGAGAMVGGSTMGQEGLAALLRLEAEVARIRAERDALVARRQGEEARLALIVGDDVARAVANDPARFLGDAGAPTGGERGAAPERTLAATSVEIAEADVRVARTGRLPTFMAGADVQVMPDGMVNGVDARVGVSVPIWSGARAQVQAAAAGSEAASRRSDAVDRGLTDAIIATHAEETAAAARLRALVEVAVPRARSAWELTVAVWSAGGGSTADLVAAWQTAVSVSRDATDAELAVELARARRARLEGR